MALLIFASRVFCYPAEAEDISGAKYFPRVKEELSNAENSIYMAMYFISFDSRDKSSSVSQLVNELVKAHERGVKIKVILDQNIAYSAWEGKWDEWKVEGKNEPIFIHLKKHGIDVFYDNEKILTHSKIMVIDEKTVILGSANWTPSSLHRNYEASVLIMSPELAKGYIESFSKILLDYKASRLDEEKEAPVRVSRSFLEDPALAGKMLNRHDENAFDLYLLLLRDFVGNPNGEVDFNYKRISKLLGMDENMAYRTRRNTIRGALKRLRDRYKLIDYQIRLAKSPYVRLLSYPNNTPYRSPEESFFLVPDTYWRYGWDKRLTFTEKYSYFINLCKAGIKKTSSWKDYIVGLVDKYNISESVISRGMMGLRKLHIIEIEYSDYEGENFSDRKSSTFKLLGLYNPQVLQAQINTLKEIHGEENIKKAIAYAEIVYKQNDLQVIEDIIKKTAQYGKHQVDRAFTIVSEYNPDNPKRSYKYVVGILQTEARAKEQN